MYDEVELRHDLSCDAKLEKISHILSRMLKDENGLVALLETLVRLTAVVLGAELRKVTKKAARQCGFGYEHLQRGWR